MRQTRHETVEKSADDEEAKPPTERVLSVKTRSNKNLAGQTPSSTIVTRKRQMSFSSDLKNSLPKSSNKNESQLNLDSYLNEDSNSSSVSCCPLNSSFNGHLSASFMTSSYKKLKTTNSNNNEASNLNTGNEDVDSVLNCPIQGCTSEGHLDGLTERHFSFDTCPIYFGMTSSECIKRRKEIESKLTDLEKKLSENNKKSSPSKVIKLIFTRKNL